MRRIEMLPALAMLAPICLAPSAVADDDGAALPIVRDREGHILSNGSGSQADEKPDGQQPDESTVEPDIISQEAARETREALKPLKKRLNTRGIRTAEIEYVEALRLWAVRQDDRLKEHQKIYAAYEKLKSYRDGVVAKGENSPRIDPRLEGMEKKLVALSEEIHAAKAELEEMTSRYEAQLKRMSQITATQHESAMAVIKPARGEKPGSGNHP